MAKNKLLEVWGDGCTQSIVFQLIGFLVLFGIFIIPAVVVTLVIGDQNSGVSLFIWIVIALVFAIMVGAFIWGRNSLRNRTQHLDAVFKLWGLKGESYYQFGRQYHGEIKGRHVDIYFQRGPTLEIQMATPLDARALIVFKSEIGKLSANLESFETVVLNNPSFHNLAFYAQDQYWLESILDEEVARQAMRQLMSVSHAYQLRQILIQPEKIKLTIRRLPIDEINTDNISAWIDDLFIILRSAETAPPPQASTVETPLEDQSKVDRKSLTILLAALGCSVLTALLICVGAVTLIVIFLSNFQ